jgi:hypothetical protein
MIYGHNKLGKMVRYVQNGFSGNTYSQKFDNVGVLIAFLPFSKITQLQHRVRVQVQVLAASTQNKCMSDTRQRELRVLIFLYGGLEQPAPACRWLDFKHKTKALPGCLMSPLWWF